MYTVLHIIGANTSFELHDSDRSLFSLIDVRTWGAELRKLPNIDYPMSLGAELLTLKCPEAKSRVMAQHYGHTQCPS